MTVYACRRRRYGVERVETGGLLVDRRGYPKQGHLAEPLLAVLAGSYLLLKLLTMLVGALTALFSGALAPGGFMRYVGEEIKSETTGHSKKELVPALIAFFFKKK